MMNQRRFGLLASVSLAITLSAAWGCSSADPESASASGDEGQASEAQADLTLKRLCAGPSNLGCAKGQFCDELAAGKCPGRTQYGVCTTKPQFCPEIYAPVCGCNGVTYSNSCFANAAGVAVASQGKCPEKGAFCGGIANIQCPEGEVCIDDPSDDCDPNAGGADCGGICVSKPAGTCGNVVCPTGTTCCNPLTSTCTPPGVFCTL